MKLNKNNYALNEFLDLISLKINLKNILYLFLIFI